MSLWFKHDAHFHEHPKCLRLRRLAGSKADAAEVGWWRIVAAAKRLNDWTFEDDNHLLDAAGRYASFIPLYRQVGFLDDLTIHNAEEYQGPKSDAERQAKSRAVRDTSHARPVMTVTPREEKSREEREEPPTPAQRGLRANGTNPRSIADRAEEARMAEIKERRAVVAAIRQRYYRGEITEAQMEAEFEATRQDVPA